MLLIGTVCSESERALVEVNHPRNSAISCQRRPSGGSSLRLFGEQDSRSSRIAVQKFAKQIHDVALTETLAGSTIRTPRQQRSVGRANTQGLILLRV